MNSSTSTTCQNVNECVGAVSPCHTHSLCTDTVGSYQCTCKVGFTGDGHTCNGECVVFSFLFFFFF